MQPSRKKKNIIKLTTLIRHRDLDSMTLAFPDVCCSYVAVDSLVWVFNTAVGVICNACVVEVKWVHLSNGKETRWH